MTQAVFRCASEGIAAEEALLRSGQPAVILWRAEKTALAIPRTWTRRDGFDAASIEAARHGWPILPRSSGGGAVPQGPGTLNLAMAAPVSQGFTIEDGYRLICGTIADTLTRFGAATETGAVEGAFCDGAWNVTAGGRKLAGTAQRWSRRGGHTIALIHAAILMDHPGAGFWPILEQIHRAGNAPVQPRPEVHVALNELLPAGTPMQSVVKTLAQTAERHLATLPAIRAQAA